jgi:1,5-anhydro-D-fructose reductase (1,5-anhydro-D-mannitol-forming)
MNANAPGWAVIGASRMAGQRMIPAMRAAGGSVLAVHSHNRERAKAFTEALQVPHEFTDLERMLALPGLDCIYVGAHPRHHAWAVAESLKAGKHTLCEPPLALDADEAERLVYMAQNRGLTLTLNHRLRAAPAIQALKRILAEETIGDLLGGRISNARLLPPDRQGWRLSEPGGGVLLDRTLHDVDLLRYLLDDEPVEVAGMEGGRILGESGASQPVMEEAFLTLRMGRSRATIQIHDSFLLPHVVDVVELYGTRGSLIVHHWTGEDAEARLERVHNGQRTELSAPFPPPPDDSHIVTVKAFLVAAGLAEPPAIGDGFLAGGDDGVTDLRIVRQIEAYLRRRRRHPLNPPRSG